MPAKFTKYNERVDLQDLIETRDSYGQPIQSWTTIANFWASVEPLRGREHVYYRQVWPTSDYFVSFNWQGGELVVKAKMRLHIPRDGRILNIIQVSMVPIERKYELLCEEHASS